MQIPLFKHITIQTTMTNDQEVANRLAELIGRSQYENSDGRFISGAQIANVYSKEYPDGFPLKNNEKVGQFLVRLSKDCGMIECKRPIGKVHMNVYLKSEEPTRPESDGSGSGSDSHQELTILRLKEEVAELKRRSVEEENSRLRKEIAKLEGIRDALGKDLTLDRAKLAEQKAEIAKLEGIRDALGKDLTLDRAKLAEQKAEIAKLQADVARLESGDE